MNLDLHTRRGEPIPHPGDKKPSGHQPPQNANTSNGTPAHPVTALDSAPTNPAEIYLPNYTADETLFRLRMRFPNLQIIPVPHVVVANALAAGVAEDMNFPDGTVAILFFATAAFYANFEGRAGVPTDGEANKSLLIPTGFPYMLYVMGKRQVSLLSVADNNVQAYCYIDMPMTGR